MNILLFLLCLCVGFLLGNFLGYRRGRNSILKKLHIPLDGTYAITSIGYEKIKGK